MVWEESNFKRKTDIDKGKIGIVGNVVNYLNRCSVNSPIKT